MQCNRKLLYIYTNMQLYRSDRTLTKTIIMPRHKLLRARASVVGELSQVVQGFPENASADALIAHYSPITTC
jgi:hypothetical protein